MKQKVYFEIVWILVTILFTALMLLPIWHHIGEGFDYYLLNALYIIITITWARVIFLLRHHWFYPNKMILGILIFVPIPIFFYLMDGQFEFQRFLDEDGIMSIMQHLQGGEQMIWSKFIKTEMIFFWAAAFVANIIIPLRMLFALSKLYRK